MFDQKFLSELSAAVAEQVISQLPDSQRKRQATEHLKLRGIRGIASYLGCSTRTAQSMKNKGLFPVYYVGKNVFAYSDEIEAGIKDRRN